MGDFNESKEFINPNTGQPETWSERMKRLVEERRAKEDAERAEFWAKRGGYPKTQAEKRAGERKLREAEKQRIELSRQAILNKCASDGSCKVTKEDLFSAFPDEVSKVGGNIYRPQLQVNPFNEFLENNNLAFVLPDLIFLKIGSNKTSAS